MKHSIQFVGLLIALIAVPVCALVWIWNPWFLDDPGSFGLMVLGPPAVLGALAGSRLSRVPGGWTGGAVAVMVAGLTLVRPLPDTAGTELLIVGIDGVTWDVADDLSLPHLERARAEGRSGVLIAEPPLFSPLLWTTMATGKRPEEHGVHGFRVRADQATAARFWEIARDAGKTVGLYKWLVTWPPPAGDVPGFVVPAWLAPDAQTHPEALSWVKELELSRRVHRKRVAAVRPMWRLGLEGLLQGVRWSTVWAAVRAQIRSAMTSVPPKKQTAFMRRLRVLIDRDLFVAQLHVHRPQLASFTMYATDALGHTHWGLQDNAVVHNAYRLSDQVLGELQRQAGPQATVLIVSDHGFRAARPEDRVHRRQPTTSALEARVKAEVGPVEVARVGHKLALTWLGEEPEAGKAALIAWLQGFVVDGSQRPLFRWEAIPERERALGLTLADDAFDALDMDDTTVQGAPLMDYVRLAEGQAGEHDERGIAVLVGPGIVAGELGEVSQLDVTPTILAALGLPVARDMPGAPWLHEAAPRVESYDHLAPEESEEPASVNEENLRALGYVE